MVRCRGTQWTVHSESRERARGNRNVSYRWIVWKHLDFDFHIDFFNLDIPHWITSLYTRTPQTQTFEEKRSVLIRVTLFFLLLQWRNSNDFVFLVLVLLPRKYRIRIKEKNVTIKKPRVKFLPGYGHNQAAQLVPLSLQELQGGFWMNRGFLMTIGLTRG